MHVHTLVSPVSNLMLVNIVLHRTYDVKQETVPFVPETVDQSIA